VSNSAGGSLPDARFCNGPEERGRNVTTRPDSDGCLCSERIVASIMRIARLGSPRFREKTGVGSREVFAFVKPNYDVISFSPFPDLKAWFLNVFEQGDFVHPGLSDVAQQFVDAIGRPIKLRSLVMDSREMIFANYFLAKPRFWREWLALAEKLFQLAESNDGPLAQRLNAPMAYYARGATPAKVFIIERLASLVVSTGEWSIDAYSSFVLPPSDLGVDGFPFELTVLDALKFAQRKIGYAQYGQAFVTLRQMVAQRINRPTIPPSRPR
jgi:hypothetical protein